MTKRSRTLKTVYNAISAFMLTVAAVTAFPVVAHAQYSHWMPFFDEWMNMKDLAPRGYVCHRISSPVTVDGSIEEAAWHYIPWTEYFADIEGDVKPVPYFRTQAKMAYDDEYFYFAADLEELHVWGTLTYHDAIIYHDNDFEIFIDPDNDNHHYYELEINALNTVWDLMLHKPYRDGGERDNDWEIPGLKTAVKVHGRLNDPNGNDAGWSIEFAIPWTVLAEFTDMPCPPHDGDRWRVNFSRVQYRFDIVDGAYTRKPGDRGENWVWSPPGVINMHCPEKWGYVMFSTGKPGTVAFVPEPTEPARMLLHTIYYAQRDLMRTHKRYAATLEELGAPLDKHKSISKGPSLELTPEGFRAFCTVNVKGQGKKTISIRQDSKITVE